MDPYERIANLYDCEHADFNDDIRFYLHAIRPGSVLEIGTGTGRIARALGEAEYQVLALDPSDAMLARARALAGPTSRITFRRGALPALDLRGQFDNVILSLNTLWHLPDQTAQLAAMRAVRDALAPGGLAFLDLTNPLSMADRGADGQVRERYRGRCGGTTLLVQSAAWDNEADQILELHLTFDCLSDDGAVERTLTELTLRYLYRSELVLMAAAADLQIRAVFGSYDLSPYAADSSNLIVVAGLS
jgi:SAM-dependent methyltransferase